MSILATRKQESIFEGIYDCHSAKLYGIILKISKNTKEAEEILMQTFRTFFLQKVKPENDERIFFYLVRIAILITSERINSPKQNIGKIILTELDQHMQLTKAFTQCGRTVIFSALFRYQSSSSS